MKDILVALLFLAFGLIGAGLMLPYVAPREPVPLIRITTGDDGGREVHLLGLKIVEMEKE